MVGPILYSFRREFIIFSVRSGGRSGESNVRRVLMSSFDAKNTE